MEFLVRNYGCLQNPWLGGYRTPDPRSVLCPQLNLLNPPPPKKIPGYATGVSPESSVLHDLLRRTWKFLPNERLNVSLEVSEEFFSAFVGKNSFVLIKMHGKTTIKNIWSYFVQFYLEREMFQTNVIEEIRTNVVFSSIFLKFCLLVRWCGNIL